MKVLIGLLALCFVIGCAPVKSLEQLEAEASVSGDWSAVEKRERILARRAATTGPSCPEGYVSYCERFGGFERCGCVTRTSMREMLAGR